MFVHEASRNLERFNISQEEKKVESLEQFYSVLLRYSVIMFLT